MHHQCIFLKWILYFLVITIVIFKQLKKGEREACLFLSFHLKLVCWDLVCGTLGYGRNWPLAQDFPFKSLGSQENKEGGTFIACVG